MERNRYIFYYNDKVIADWWATEEQMKFHAQGMCIGIRQFRAKAEIHVYKVDENGTEKLFWIQR